MCIQALPSTYYVYLSPSVHILYVYLGPSVHILYVYLRPTLMLNYIRLISKLWLLVIQYNLSKPGTIEQSKVAVMMLRSGEKKVVQVSNVSNEIALDSCQVTGLDTIGHNLRMIVIYT